MHIVARQIYSRNSLSLSLSLSLSHTHTHIHGDKKKIGTKLP